MYVIIFSAAILIYLVHAIYPLPIISQILSMLCLLSIMLSYLRVRRVVQVLSGCMLAGGSVLLFMAGATPLDFLNSFGYMINVLTLFALVPLMAIPMQAGRYGEAVQQIVRHKVKTSGGLYMLTAALTHFLAVFTYLAALPMMYYAIRPSADLYSLRDQEQFMSRAVVQGFSMTTMWTPVAPILATVIAMTEVSWGSIIGYVLTLSLLGLALAMAMGYWSERRLRGETASINAMENNSMGGQPPEREVYRKALHAVAAILILSLVTFLLERLLPINFLFIIMLLILPFGMVWSLAIGKIGAYWAAVKAHPVQYLPKMKDQFVIFLSAGFFITVLEATGASITINHALSEFKDFIGVSLFIILIPLIPLGLAFIGMHPAVALALVAQSLNPAILGISPQLLTVSMLTGAAASFLMGPYNATVGMMAGIVKRSPYQVSNWNFPYTVAFLVVAMVYLVLLQIIL